MEKSVLYIDKPDGYFSGVRWDIISFIPHGPHRILDVGCGNGATLLQLREMGKAQEIFGVELNESYINESTVLDGLYIGDVETADIPFRDKTFDFIIFADILEHLINPSSVLRKYKMLLSERGFIIASIPNIKNYLILLNLIFLDKFEYVPAGILDRSHLRFFTKREIYRMFENENLQIIMCECNLSPKIAYIDNKLKKILSKYLPGISFFTIQYIVMAQQHPRIQFSESQSIK